jgi:hypothetical protein
MMDGWMDDVCMYMRKRQCEFQSMSIINLNPKRFVIHVFFQVSRVIFCRICFMGLMRVLALGCYLDPLWWVTIVSLLFWQQIVE